MTIGRGNLSRLAPACPAALAALACTATIAAAATAPTVRTGRASGLTPQTATISGTVNPHGVPTAYYFQFGRTKGYGARTSTGDAGSGTTAGAFSASLTGLRPNTLYHYRLVAFSTAGTTRAGDRAFRTPQIPTTLTLAASPNPVAFSGIASITGVLSGPDISAKKVALLGNPFPFAGPFQQIGNTVLTNPQGGYGFIVPVSVALQLRVVAETKPPVTSPTVIQNVALATTLRVRHARRGRIRFSGRVTPARVGNAVLIQRRTRRGWATVGLGLTRARNATYSGFSRRLRLRRSGKYRALVRTTGGDYVDGTSRSVRVKLRRHRRG